MSKESNEYSRILFEKAKVESQLRLMRVHNTSASLVALSQDTTLSSIEKKQLEKHHRDLRTMQDMVVMLQKNIDAKLDELDGLYDIDHNLESHPL